MTFKAYLEHIGIDPSTKSAEALAELRQEYRRYYNRQYSKNYRKKFKRFEVQFNHVEHEQIKNTAKNYNIKPAPFIKKATLAYLHSDILLPDFKHVEELTYLVRKASNNVNQLVKATHISKYLDEQRLEALVNECHTMEQAFQAFYSQPKVHFKPLDLCS